MRQLMESLPKHFLLACLLFVLSGALGLGYQLVWIRKASLIVGASQLALSTVVTSFFLGLGSLFVGKYLRSRRFSPLLVYGAFEAAIGTFALLFPQLFEVVEAIYGSLYSVPWIAGSSVALFISRFALLFLLFLPPTFFMGGTLPLLLDGLVARNRSIGSLTSVLYGLNIVGAVSGVLLTGYFAIPGIGMNATSMLFGLGNLSIAAIAVAAFRKQAPPNFAATEAGAGDPLPKLFVAMSFASGFAAIGYQIAWVRYFSLFSNASVYLTAILLATYLFALAVGSMLLAPLLSRGVRPLRIVAMVQPLVVFFVLVATDWWTFADYRFGPAGPPGSYEVVPSWYFVGELADSIFFAPLFQVALVLFVPVVLLGTGLPALIAAATRESEALRMNAGSLIFWNTIGSSAGGFAAGYLLLPAFGLVGTFFILCLVTLALGLAAEWSLSGTKGPRHFSRGALLRVVIATGALGYAFFSLGDDLTRRTLRDYGPGRFGFGRLVEVNEGPLTTAFFFESASTSTIGAGNVVLAVVSHDFATTQAIQGHIPALFYPRPGAPKRSLGIVLGTGQSFGALLQHPIESLDIVDISSEMIELSLRRFAQFNHDLGNDPRVEIHLDDGRHFVDRAASASYDVLSMEPPPPTDVGVYSLYSLEFYQSVARVLREDGILMQWLPLYRLTPDDVRGLVKTQAAVFPQTFVVKAGIGDFMVLSFNRSSPPVWRTEWIEERAEIFLSERLMAEKRWPKCEQRVASLRGVLAMLITGPDDIARMETPLIYRDDDQRLSYTSGDRELMRRHEGKVLASLAFSALPVTLFEELQRYFAEPLDVAALEAVRECSLSAFRFASSLTLAQIEKRYRSAASPAAKRRLAMQLAELSDRALAKDRAREWIGRAIAADPTFADPKWLARARSMARHEIAISAPGLERWIERERRQLGEEVGEKLAAGGSYTLVLEVMEDELRDHQRRESRRRAKYLFP